MKTNRDLILGELKKAASFGSSEKEGLSTLFLSTVLGLQRTNISSILNRLVQDGVVDKSNGRPVLYRLSKKTSEGEVQSCFENLIGFDGSLKNAIQLAKAAILYPVKSLHTLIEGPSGSGKSSFAKYMYMFALETKVLKVDAPFIKLNCKNYIGNESAMEHDLFGRPNLEFENYFEQAQSGILFVDNIHELTALAKAKLFEFIETNHIVYHNSNEVKELNVTLICASDSLTDKAIRESYENRFPVKIRIPSLQDRSLQERFELVQVFFAEEATRIKKTLKINSELLRCLLLYQCKFNVKQLRRDIQLGCAKAFVREFNQAMVALEVYVSDMEHYVRKGFLNYKYHREEIEGIIPNDYSYSFAEGNIDRHFNEQQAMEGKSIYDLITYKVAKLSERGIQQKDISLLLSVEVEDLFRKYRKDLTQRVVNKKQLSKIVDEKIMMLVEGFLKDACIKFNKDYPASVFYGLCLHLNSAIDRIQKAEILENKQISDNVEEYKEEYAFCLQFASKIEDEFKLHLPIDEVVIITMFICDYEQQNEVKQHPVVLVAMHGDGAAREIAEVINTLVKSDNVYHYDLNLDKNSEEAYQELKDKVISIHQGKGVIVLYDMGSIHKMGEMIMDEINVYMRFVQIPITLFGLELARKAAMGDNIDIIVNSITGEFINYISTSMNQGEVKKKKCIITLCNTGEGGALEVKHYLEQEIDMKDTTMVPLAISDRVYLRSEVTKVMEEYEVICCIGTFDPKLFDIPFISIANIFEQSIHSLEDVLGLIGSEANLIDYVSIYEYLDDQLDYVDIEKVKKVFPPVLRDIKYLVNNSLSLDQELGLFVHLVCSVNRMLSGALLPTNVKKEIILRKNETLFKELLKALRPIEKTFGIIISDDEMANVVSIVKKI